MLYLQVGISKWPTESNTDVTNKTERHSVAVGHPPHMCIRDRYDRNGIKQIQERKTRIENHTAYRKI